MEISETEKQIITIYRNASKKEKKYIMDMMDVIMFHCMKNSEKDNVYDMAAWKQKRSIKEGQTERKDYIYRGHNKI